MTLAEDRATTTSGASASATALEETLERALDAVGAFDIDEAQAEIEAAWRSTKTPQAFRKAVTPLLRARLEGGREAIGDALLAGDIDGRGVARAMARLTDEIVRLVFIDVAGRVHAAPNPTKTEKIAVVAVGGYGRAEMAPYSDVDLLFLTPYKQTAWGESLIETALYVLWDLKCKVGHSVRSVDECLRQARDDVTIRTALLEKRFLTGEGALFDELNERLWSDLFSKTAREFVDAKLAERDARHETAGGSRYLVEPNVKDSKGGLRDLQNLFWIAKYIYRSETPAEFVAQGVFEAEEAEIFDEAERFFWTVRCHLHFVVNRAQEKLTFDRQIEIAERMGYAGGDGMQAVERFMQDYYRHALKVGELTRFFCAALEAQHAKRRPGLAGFLRNLKGGDAASGEEGLEIRDGRLAVSRDDWFSDDPINLLRIFEAGLRTGALIHPEAFRLMMRSLDLIDDDVRADPEANRIFLNLLTSKKNPERALRRMNETGVLSAFIPEFERVVALMQFNMYHSYTVDEHTIGLIRELHRIENGDLDDVLPIASKIMQGEVNREALFVAAFLHDIGKGLERPHSDVGAEVAMEVCPRLGLSEDDTEMVAWLVQNHLLMSDVAQRRDISDEATIRAFAKNVQSPERLKLLLVLTACDIRAVGPDAWNNWKAQLLRQLYRETYNLLTGGEAVGSRDDQVQHAQETLRKRLQKRGWDEEEIETIIARQYPSYWIALDADTHALHATMMHTAGEKLIVTRFRPDESRDATKACFYMSDHPGLFGRIAGALALAGANVVDARTFTTRDGMAASVFWVQDRDGAPYDPTRIDRLKRTLDRTLNGEVIPRDELRERRKLKAREQSFTVPTRISFDNKASEIYSVIEVQGRDRTGLLFDLTRALTSCHVNIFSAIIATYGERAVDVFYVKDMFGLKITNPNKQRAIQRKLREAIDRAALSASGQ